MLMENQLFYSSPGSSVWISAPGGDFGISYPAILTTDIMGCSKGYSSQGATANDFESGGAFNSNCNYTSTMNGTSAATPMVSGVVAAMLSANPNLSWRDVKYILASTARQVDLNSFSIDHPFGNDLSGHIYLQGWRTNAAGFKFHNWYGFGAVNGDAAILMAKTILRVGEKLKSLYMKVVASIWQFLIRIRVESAIK